MFILIFHSLKKWSHGKRHTFQNDGALSLAPSEKHHKVEGFGSRFLPFLGLPDGFIARDTNLLLMKKRK